MLTQLQPLPLVSAYIAQDHGILQYIVDSQGSPVAVDDIAKATNLSPRDTGNLLEYLSVQSMIQETSRGHYRPTKLSHLLLDKLFKDAVIHL
jgi:Holliday junction resolvasome RuvABC ATP-dependent DNA helicase subunit